MAVGILLYPVTMPVCSWRREGHPPPQLPSSRGGDTRVGLGWLCAAKLGPHLEPGFCILCYPVREIGLSFITHICKSKGSLRGRSNARHVSTLIPLRWPNYLNNQVDKIKYSFLPHQRRTTVSFIPRDLN